jgi:hypothetical protein
MPFGSFGISNLLPISRSELSDIADRESNRAAECRATSQDSPVFQTLYRAGAHTEELGGFPPARRENGRLVRSMAVMPPKIFHYSRNACGETPAPVEHHSASVLEAKLAFQVPAGRAYDPRLNLCVMHVAARAGHYRRKSQQADASRSSPPTPCGCNDRWQDFLALLSNVRAKVDPRLPLAADRIDLRPVFQRRLVVQCPD